MVKLVESNILPKKFTDLKGQKKICQSFIFGKIQKQAWRAKDQSGKKEIRKPNENYPGAKASIDKLVVAQPALEPRISGKHNNSRICGATGFFDDHTSYSSSSLQTSLDGEQTLAIKHGFESHAEGYEVRIKSCRADIKKRNDFITM